MIDDLRNGRQGHLPADKRTPKRGGYGRVWKAVAIVVGSLLVLGLGYLVIHHNLLRKTIDELLGGRSRVSATSAFLGITVQNLKQSVAQSLDLKSKASGVVVTRVLPGTPADKGGIEPGDLIVQADRSLVTDVSTLERIVREARPGETIKIVVDRQGVQRTFYVELAELPSYVVRTALGAQTGGSEDGWGCTVAPLTPELAKQLSLPSSVKGVVVVAVAPGGAAAAAGVQPGDLIVSVNREETPDLAAFYAKLAEIRNPVLGIYRDGQSLYLQIQTGTKTPPLATIAGVATGGVSLPQRVAVAADGIDLNAPLSARFGTAPYFVIADFGTNSFQTVQNATQSTSRGYGITAAQLVASQGAGATIAQAYGPQAYDALKALNVIPFTAAGGRVSQVLTQYRANLLTMVAGATLPGYGYSSSIMATGGGSSSDADSDDEGGYKGMPSVIPPRGKYDPGTAAAADPVQTTAGASQRADYCYCPICGKLVPHPPNVSCSELTCPDCGSRLRNWDSGSVALLPSTSPTATVPSASLPSTSLLPTLPALPSLSRSPVGTLPPAGMGGPTQVPMLPMQSQSQGGRPQGNTGMTGTTLTQQQVQYCYCPICGALYPHPAGVPCSTLTCPVDGSRLLSVTSGAAVASQTPSAVGRLPSGIPPMGLSVGGKPDTIPPGGASGSSAAGVTVAGPSTIPPGGPNTSATSTAGTPSASTSVGPTGKVTPSRQPLSTIPKYPGVSVGGQPTTIPPTGSAAAGMPTAGMPTAGMPTAGMPTAGMPTAGMPTAGMPTAGMPTAGMPTAGMPTGGPTTIPPMGSGAAGMPTAGMPTAGMPTAGMPTGGPTTIPPMGSGAAGMPTGGQPTTIPPMGSSAAGMPVGGKPDTIPPGGASGQAAAGTTVAGPSTIPPGGPPQQGTASTRQTASTAAGQPVAGQPTTIPPMGGGQSVAPTQSGARIVGSGQLPFTGQVSAGTADTSSAIGALQGTIDGYCVCPKCGAKVPHVRGTACYTTPCPRCGTPMVREGVFLSVGGGSPTATVLGESNALTVAGTAGGICIAASGPSMDSKVAPLFDRAPYFLIVGLGTCKVIANPNVDDRAGVGIQSAQLVVSEGANVVITNDISLKALEELSRLRIRVYPGVTGTAQQALSWYQDGRLTPSSLSVATDPNHDEHSSSGGKGRDSKSSTSSSSTSTSSGSSSSSSSSSSRKL